MTAAEAIETCNLLLWGYMYPAECGYAMPFKSVQHKALILTFMAGLMLGTRQARSGKPCLEALFQELTDPNWQPDDRFRPTSHANN